MGHGRTSGVRRAAAMVAGTLALAAPATASADINVTTTTDAVANDANCSLREAITLANTDTADASGCVDSSSSGPDTIQLPAGTYTLTGADGEDVNASGDLDVKDASATDEGGDLTIIGVGDGTGETEVNGNDVDRVFDVLGGGDDAVDFAVEALKVSGGRADAGATDDGGGIRMQVSNGAVTVRSATFESNDATRWGGAISWDNSSSGGGAPLEVIDSEFVGNSAASGGAIWTNNGGFSSGLNNISIGGATRVEGSTFTGNVATRRGGAIYLKGPSDGGGGLAGLSVLNSTLHDNDAGDGDGATAGGGGAIAMGAGQSLLYVYFSTVTGNSSLDTGTSGGLQTDDAGTGQQVVLRGNILAGNTATGSGTDVNCLGTGNSFANLATSRGGNVESANTCDLSEAGSPPDNVNESSLGLAALTDNGGETRTRAIGETSPAVDFVPPSACKDFVVVNGVETVSVTEDQRGQARPARTACDAGAFELQATDTDGDGIVDGSDNCPSIANATQANNDGDSQGDACDSDDDNDGVADGSDNCSTTANASQANNDGDSQGDACDTDDDNDGVADVADNCQTSSNPGQGDQDGDGQGDACDSDVDGDGVTNPPDNCPQTANASQANNDGDSQGDACETDDDNDGRSDADDSCPNAAGGSATGCPEVERELKLEYSKDKKAFKGKLAADVGECIDAQKVAVYRQVDGKDDKVGSDKTDDAGKYKIEAGAKAGTYYAQVEAAEVSGVATCLKAKSGKVKLK
jgi:CSLREA domain-containing protein